ncbi:MAG: TPM domain-containing protein [bacterium]
MKNSIHKILNKVDLNRISETIAEVERMTSAEVRVLLRERRSTTEQQITIEELAQKEFHSLGMAQTRDRNGVLILILYQERKVRIHVDLNAHSIIAPEEWQRLVKAMTANFSERRFRDGIILAVREAGAILAKHYPPKSDDTNELSNDVVVK